jgi:heptosyltransferase I
VSEGEPRFLIVRLGSLGDVVHAIPAVAALKRHHPAAAIDWIVDPRYADLVGCVTAVDRVIGYDPRESWWASRTVVGRLRRSRYHAAIDLQGLLKSAVLARAAGARRTIGFTRAQLREPLAALFYTDAHDPGDLPHVIHKGIALIQTVAVTDASIAFPLELPPSRVAEGISSRVGGAGYALINPGAAWPNKRWPPARFGEVARRLRDRLGMTSLVLWGPGEETMAAQVVAASSGAAERLARTTIVDIAAVAQGARLMLSGDTGPLHIAAAVGTPIVALFGPTRAERNGPWAPADISISRYDQCGCHYERRCRRDRPCIDDISVDEVLATIERRLAAR